MGCVRVGVVWDDVGCQCGDYFKRAGVALENGWSRQFSVAEDESKQK
jgi:hypothetical protein